MFRPVYVISGHSKHKEVFLVGLSKVHSYVFLVP